MQLWKKCFIIAVSLPGHVSDYIEEKRSAVAAHMQSEVFVEWSNSES